MSEDVRRVESHDADGSRSALSRRSLRTPPSQGRFVYARTRPGAGSGPMCRAIGHTEHKSTTGGDVRTHDLPRDDRRGDEEFIARPIDLNAASSSVRRGGDPINDENRPDAPPLPGRAAPRTIAPRPSPWLSRPRYRSRTSRTPARPTWPSMSVRSTGARVSGTSSSSSAVQKIAGTFPEGPRWPCTSPVASRSSGPRPTTATAEPAASSSTCVGTGPVEPTVFGFDGWSAFNARANIMVTMRMVHRKGSWSDWGF